MAEDYELVFAAFAISSFQLVLRMILLDIFSATRKFSLG